MKDARIDALKDSIETDINYMCDRAYALGYAKAKENKPMKVTVETFVKLYKAETLKFLEMCEQGLDDGNSPINKDMTITWNGVTCNIGNGASVSNHVVDGIENFLREDDGVEPKDWEEEI
jgi:hypothetical protein